MLSGILFALGASVAWAVANVFIQRSGQRMGTVRAMFWSLAVGALAAGVCGLLLDSGARDFSARNLGWLGLCVALGLVANIGLFHAFATGRLTITVPVVTGWSLVSALVSIAFLGESVTVGQAIAAATVFVGLMIVAALSSRGADPAAGGRVHRLALMAAFVAALGFGVFMPILAMLGPSFGELTSSSLLFSGYVVVALPLAVLFRRSLAWPSPGDWPLVLVAGIAEVAGVTCLVLARQYAPMTAVGPLSSLSATFTVAYSWAVLRDRPAPAVMLGGIMVCGGVVALAL